MKSFDESFVSFGRHESFALRFGWITKGYKALYQNPGIFGDDDATVTLGVGKNMVHAIRYWLNASQVVEAKKHVLEPTQLGRLIFDLEKGHDPYLEDDATIWLLHWLIASNARDATSFFWFFNRFHKPEFTHKELFDALRNFIKENTGIKSSEKTLNSDITLLIRMYETTIDFKSTPAEESLDSPMSLLGLINKTDESKYHVSGPENRWDLPLMPFAYSVLSVFNNTKLSSLPIERLMTSDGVYAAPGSVFRLNEEGLVSKLEEMTQWLPGHFELRKTAGIHQLYEVDHLEPLRLLDKYYKSTRNSRLETAA
jgi:uncharacterized protein DUF4007